MNTDTDLEIIARSYLNAFEARDLRQCMSFYTDDSVVNFVHLTYRGKQQIEEWHKDRFAAGLQLRLVQTFSAKDDTVVLEGAASSKRLKEWGIKTMAGTVTARFDGDKIKEVTFTGRHR